ncbi:hypothetical protein [Pseudoduganella lutea]|uniref:Iron uptake protein n=1 Tax=Pseudoduganella lutea TaxID=321985 RepID=A0A4P6KST8_9BURK|nr:hypothetical protein [Pseudoduganella lutea]QBE61704.1 hypothetical protein EWM63_00745 [Pseudoduganella lutea]
MRCGSDGVRPVLRLSLRLVGAIGGGYACTALAVTTGAALLAGAGMVRSEAVVLMAMLGFPLYLVLLVWGFAVRRVRTLWLVLGALAGALALAGLAAG